MKWYCTLLVSVIFTGCSGSQDSKPTVPEPAGTGAASASASRAPIPPGGEWVPCSQRTLTSHYPAVGSMHARRITRVGPQVGGRVEAVLVDEGKVVKAGAELVRLESVFFELAVQGRKAEVQAAWVSKESAELQFSRMRNLWEKPKGEAPSIPRKLFDDARSALQGAEARVLQAEAAMKDSEQRLRETVIRSPYDAVVSRRFVDPGEPVTATPVTHLLELQDLSSLELLFALPQRLLGSIGVSTPIEFEVDGVPGGPWQSEVSVILPDLDVATRSFRCKALVKNPTGLFRPGLLGRVRVVEAQLKDRLAVPQGALERYGKGWRARVRVGDGAEWRTVSVGLETKDYVEIRSGLSVNDRVYLPKSSGSGQ